MRIKLLHIVFLSAILISCTKESKELKLVQQQQAGEYKVSILSETGSLTHGNSSFILEFRKAADNTMADVGTVDVAPVMEMAGMSPMMATTQVTPLDTPGRYKVVGNLTMSGHWKVNVTFGKGQNARFNVSAE